MSRVKVSAISLAPVSLIGFVIKAGAYGGAVFFGIFMVTIQIFFHRYQIMLHYKTIQN